MNPLILISLILLIVNLFFTSFTVSAYINPRDILGDYHKWWDRLTWIPIVSFGLALYIKLYDSCLLNRYNRDISLFKKFKLYLSWSRKYKRSRFISFDGSGRCEHCDAKKDCSQNKWLVCPVGYYHNLKLKHRKK